MKLKSAVFILLMILSTAVQVSAQDATPPVENKVRGVDITILSVSSTTTDGETRTCYDVKWEDDEGVVHNHTICVEGTSPILDREFSDPDKYNTSFTDYGHTLHLFQFLN